MVRCHQCGQLNETGERVGRRDTCAGCDADLHVCLDCGHYDPSAYNECREPQADRVLEKDKANFCDYFIPSDKALEDRHQEKGDAKKKIADLFKKK